MKANAELERKSKPREAGKCAQWCSHRIGDLCEVGVLEVGSERNCASLLLLNIDEVEELIIEDGLNDRNLSFHLR